MVQKNVWKTTFRSTSEIRLQGAGKTIEKPLKELPWNQQIAKVSKATTVKTRKIETVFKTGCLVSYKQGIILETG